MAQHCDSPGRRAWLAAAALAAAGCAAPPGGPGPGLASTRVDLPVGSRRLSGRALRAGGRPARGLLFAIPGGGYTSKYFDADGSSVMQMVAALGYDVVAVDRPGYGANPGWLLDFDGQAAVLAEAVAWAAARYGAEGQPPMLYGHSVGGMLALLVANLAPAACLGLNMTGSGPLFHERTRKLLAARAEAPATPTHDMNGQAQRIAMFMGPEGGYDPAVARLDPERDAPSAVTDLRDVVRWEQRMPAEAARVRVPVQFVMPEHDALFRADDEAQALARRLFSAAPLAEVTVQRGAGHSVELQHLARAHVLRVVAFAEQCRALRGRRA